MINPDKARQRIEWMLAANPEMRLATFDVGSSRLDCNCPVGLLVGDRYPTGRGSREKQVQVRPEQLEEIIMGFEGKPPTGGWMRLGASFRAHERFVG